MRQRLALPDNDLLTQYRRTAAPNSPTLFVRSNQYVLNGNYVEMSCYKDLRFPNAANPNLYFNSPSDLTMPGRRLGRQPRPVTANSLARSPAYTNDWSNSFAPSSYPTLAEEAPLTGGLFSGEDVLLTNVVSFGVRVLIPRSMWSASVPYDFIYLGQLDPNTGVPILDPFCRVPNPNVPPVPPLIPRNPNFNDTNLPYVFDTWSNQKDQTCDYSGWLTTTGGRQHSIPMFENRNVSKQYLRILAIEVTIRIWDNATKQIRQTSIVVDL
jgi:hypothetical protein